MPLGIDGWAVENDTPFNVETVLLHGSDDADDLHLPLRVAPEVSAERVAVGPEALRELFVDDDHLLRSTRQVGIGEGPPLEDRDPHRPKVLGGGGPLIDLKFLAGFWRPAFDVDRAPADRSRERQRRYRASRGDTRHAGQRFTERPIVGHGSIAVSELARAHAYPHRDHAFGVEPRRDVLETHQTAHEQAGADQEHQRNRDFRDDEPTAKAPPRAAEAPLSPRAAAAGLHRRAQIHPHGACRRHQTENHTGQDGHRQRERENGGIKRDGLEPRNVSGIGGSDDLQCAVRNRETGGTPEEAEQNALGQQLPYETLPAGAQGRADRDFLLAPGRSREQQVGHIGARDQKDEGDRPEEHEHREPHVAHHRIDERHNVDGEGPIALVLLADTRRDRRHIVVGLRQRHTWFQARHDVVVLVTTQRRRIFGEGERQEHIHLLDAPDRGHDLLVQQERPEHADDFELVLRVASSRHAEVVQPDRLTHDRGIATKGAFPEPVAQNRDGVLPRSLV